MSINTQAVQHVSSDVILIQVNGQDVGTATSFSASIDLGQTAVYSIGTNVAREIIHGLYAVSFQLSGVQLINVSPITLGIVGINAADVLAKNNQGPTGYYTVVQMNLFTGGVRRTLIDCKTTSYQIQSAPGQPVSYSISGIARDTSGNDI